LGNKGWIELSTKVAQNVNIPNREKVIVCLIHENTVLFHEWYDLANEMISFSFQIGCFYAESRINLCLKPSENSWMQKKRFQD
jgi:hypothetical protein